MHHVFCEKHEYSESGTDLTRIRWMLSLTPASRLEWLQDQFNAQLVAHPELAWKCDDEDH